MAFIKAVRSRAKLKLALIGPTGSGKTKGALRLARGLTNGGTIAVIDTENRSASLYAGETVVDARDEKPYQIDFIVDDIFAPFTAEKFLESFKGAVAAGAKCIIIDSFSHVWEAVLSYKEKLDSLGGNSYTNWNDAGRKFKNVVDFIRQSDVHCIVCMRSKMDYVMELNAKGKMEPRKVGLAPIVRNETEYEFSALFEVDSNHLTRDTKGRFPSVLGEEPFMITESTGSNLAEWLDSGVEAPPENVWTDALKAEAKALCEQIAAKPGSEAAATITNAKLLGPIEALAILKDLLNTTKES
jgi:hypothetical protein